MLTFNALLWPPQEAGIDNVIVPKKSIFFNYLENCKTYQGRALSVICVSLFCTNWVLYVFHCSVQIECYVCFTVLYKLSVMCVSLLCTNWVLYVFHCSVQIECYACFTVLYKLSVMRVSLFCTNWVLCVFHCSVHWPSTWKLPILEFSIPIGLGQILFPLPPSTDVTGQIPSTRPT